MKTDPPGPTPEYLYTPADLREGDARKSAEWTYPQGWAAFAEAAKGGLYSRGALTDAWLWFLKGWTSAPSGAVWERVPEQSVDPEY